MRRSKKGPKPGVSLEEEIEMLRKALRQAFQLSQEAQSTEEKLRALGALGAAAARLANMVKVQRQLNQGRESELEEAINAAIEEAAREMGLQL